MGQHALLSASSAHRWMECLPSAVLESQEPDNSSDASREGTLAHAIGALKIKQALGIKDTSSEEREIAELHDEFYSGQMEELTDMYRDMVLSEYNAASKKTKCEIHIEKRLDFSEYVPEGFGTGDAVIAGNGILHIIDLKYGQGVEVSADHNPQLMLYALGAISAFDYCYDFDSVKMTIFQPRKMNLSQFEMDASDLLRWAKEELIHKAALAFRGIGARKTGEHCRFCRAKGRCPQLAMENLTLFENQEGTNLTAEELGEHILPYIPRILEWADKVQSESLRLAMEGNTVPGYKVVEGRGRRKIVEPERAMLALAEYDRDKIYKPVELLGLTALEKNIGKKRLGELIGDCIQTVAGSPLLVPESDKRKAMDSKDDFSGMI